MWLQLSKTAAMAMFFSALAALAPLTARADDNWPALRTEFFGTRDITEGQVPLAIEAPDKAEDSAIVPVAIYLFGSIAGNVKTMHLFIENNPMPLVGKFEFGPAGNHLQGDIFGLGRRLEHAQLSRAQSI